MSSTNEFVREVSIDQGLVTIRDLRPGDAPAMLEFINALSRERTFVLFQGEQLTLEQEEAWLGERLTELKNGTGVSLGAFFGDRAIGSTAVVLKPLAERHVGVFGLSVSQEFRGLGIGSALIEAAIAEATEHLTGLRIIELSVFANNPVAISMYRKFGFVEHGRLPEGIAHRGEWIDHILMHRNCPGSE